MKITEIRTYPVHAGRQNLLFVVVHTADGRYGVGEAGLPARVRAVAAAVEHLTPLLLGEDATRVEHLWQVMFRGAHFPAQRVSTSALAAIDIALWDLRGKRLGVPVYELLGGKVRDRVHAHTQVRPGLDAAAAVREAVAEGWRALRWGLPDDDGVIEPQRAIRQALDTLAAARAEAGDEVELILDVHTRLRPAEAVRLCRLVEPHRPYFVEDPLRSENLDSYRRLRACTAVPIAAGARLSSKWELRTLLEEGLIDVARVDLGIAGGLTEAVKIAAGCETRGIDVAVRNRVGPVATAASAHFSLAITPVVTQELLNRPGTLVPDVVAEQPVRLDHGDLHVTDAPGLGVTFDPEAALTHPYQEQILPQLRRPDGSYANW